MGLNINMSITKIPKPTAGVMTKVEKYSLLNDFLLQDGSTFLLQEESILQFPLRAELAWSITPKP